jgi:nicotinamidase-related amidase
MNPEKWTHLCIDMQRMFAESTPWQVAWIPKVFDQVAEVATRFPDRTIFTRFVPPSSPEEMPGMWRPYYEKWPMMTTSELDPVLVDLVPDLKRLVPPARIFDKTTYSPWTSGRLHNALLRQDIGTLVVTGGETDICVLATALGAIDLGYRVILLKDALWSTTGQTHDASLQLLGNRFSVQVDVINTDGWLSSL